MPRKFVSRRNSASLPDEVRLTVGRLSLFDPVRQRISANLLKVFSGWGPLARLIDVTGKKKKKSLLQFLVLLHMGFQIWVFSCRVQNGWITFQTPRKHLEKSILIRLKLQSSRVLWEFGEIVNAFPVNLFRCGPSIWTKKTSANFKKAHPINRVFSADSILRSIRRWCQCQCYWKTRGYIHQLHLNRKERPAWQHMTSVLVLSLIHVPIYSKTILSRPEVW